MQQQNLQNEHITVVLCEDQHGKPSIGISDIQDVNERRAYNKSKRGVEKAFEALKAAFTGKTTLYKAVEILEANGVEMNEYNGVD